MSNKRMLIDASHPEETRVVVLSGNRLEEFDHETTAKKQLKGNIYLAKVTRVEPSLQAAFVEYGGNRHGFLPFSEIHPDYYKIPIADRRRLLAEEAARQRQVDPDEGPETEADDEPEAGLPAEEALAADDPGDASQDWSAAEPAGDEPGPDGEADGEADDEADGELDEDPEELLEADADPRDAGTPAARASEPEEVVADADLDVVGGDEIEENARKRSAALQRYKIQEVIKRRQVILVQVAKEERGTKGAALTTYLSLAGRYCVLMPNTARGGGISRKIGSATDRRRLKKVVSDLEIPDGMAVIVRTAGSQRSKAEIRRDYEYLIRLWDQIRETTLQSTAPCLIHEEANLIKRAIRDLYDRDMDSIEVQGEEAYKEARNFMKNLIPSHARKVQLYKDPAVPLFFRNQVEDQMDAMHQPTVRLKSGGYIVMNPTEALVAIDVNSGKATRERHIEETALKTNLEAADEVARQLRLRDLAGLIVIDFIDMEENRHNRDVERRLKDAMRLDRARIQLGRISPFGLLELSRQRLRPSLFENSTELCPACGGTGHVRSIESSALHVLRALEEEGMRRPGGSLEVKAPTAVAFYILNQKRDRLSEIEQRYGFRIHIVRDDGLVAPSFSLTHDGGESRPSSRSGARPAARAEEPARPADEDEDEPYEGTAQEGRTQEVGAQEGARRKRRRRRSRKRDDAGEALGERPQLAADAESEAEDLAEEDAVEQEASGRDGAGEAEEGEDGGRKGRRRRGKRGGRRRSRLRRDDEGDTAEGDTAEPGQAAAQQPEDAEPEPEGEPQGEPEWEPQGEPEWEPQGEPEWEPQGEPGWEPADQPDRHEVPERIASRIDLDELVEDLPEPPAAGTHGLERPELESETTEEDSEQPEPALARFDVPAPQPAPPAQQASDGDSEAVEPEEPALPSEHRSEPVEEKPKRRGWWNRLV